jgi:hypothetical protein
MLRLKIKSILENKSLSSEDKLIEIAKLTVINSGVEVEQTSIGRITRHANGNVVIDGSYAPGVMWTDEPRLSNRDELYYQGDGCTWGNDLDGKRYWKLYDRFKMDRHRTDPIRQELYGIDEIYNFEEWLKRKVKSILEDIGND